MSNNNNAEPRYRYYIHEVVTCCNESSFEGGDKLTSEQAIATAEGGGIDWNINIDNMEFTGKYVIYRKDLATGKEEKIRDDTAPIV
jgi:hypothetical protein